MAVTAQGFNEELDEKWWAEVAPAAGSPYQVIEGLTIAVNEVSGPRVRLRTGKALVYGVLVTLTADEVRTLDVPSSGSRWDTLVLRIDWENDLAEVVVVKGGSAMRPPTSLRNTPGTIVELPLFLLQVTVGQNRITDSRDWRVFGAKLLTTIRAEALPPIPNGRAYVNGLLHRYNGTDWIPDTGPGWQDLRLISSRTWPGHGFRPQYRIDGQRIDLRGRIQRTNDPTFLARSEGWPLAYIDGVSAYNVCTVNSTTAFPKLVMLTGGESGSNTLLTGYPAQETTWIDLGGGVLWLN